MQWPFDGSDFMFAWITIVFQISMYNKDGPGRPYNRKSENVSGNCADLGLGQPNKGCTVAQSE